MARPSKIRQLGTFERFRVVLHDLGFHNNVAILACFSGPSCSREQKEGLIFHALQHAIDVHPALGVAVAGKHTNRPFFERIEEIDLRKVVTFEELTLNNGTVSEHVDEILSRQHSIGFMADDLPLWRIVVLEDSTRLPSSTMHIAFMWHHVIGDGKSGLAVISIIHQAFNSFPPHSTRNSGSKFTELHHATSTNKSIHSVVKAPFKPLFPALEELLALPMSVKTMILHTLRFWLPWWFNQVPALGKWSGSCYQWKEPILTKIHHLDIPLRVAEGLMQRCRSERTTMTPFLQAGLGKVILEAFPEAEWLRCAVALSQRRFLPAKYQIDDSVMGLWVNAFHLDYARNQLQGGEDADSLLWDQARKGSQRINSELEKGEKDVGIAELQHVPDFKSSLLAKIGQPRQDSYAVTNLGLYRSTADQTDAWQLSALYFSQSCHVNGSAIQFCICTLEGSSMRIALSWQEGVIEREDVTRIAENLEKKLVQLGSSSTAGAVPCIST